MARSEDTKSEPGTRIRANRAHTTLIRLSQGGKADSCVLTTPQKFELASEFFNRIGRKPTCMTGGRLPNLRRLSATADLSSWLEAVVLRRKLTDRADGALWVFRPHFRPRVRQVPVLVVEAAGIEPASVSPRQSGLHA